MFDVVVDVFLGCSERYCVRLMYGCRMVFFVGSVCFLLM